MNALQNYDYPGNVRELENILERAYTLCEAETIQPDDLQLTMASDIGQTSAPAVVTSASTQTAHHTSADDDVDIISAAVSLPAGVNLEEHLERIERSLITQALDNTRWNKTAAAKELGITFRALRYKLKKLDME
jgi:two-component system response regulator PilR (NtrC family)